MRPAAAAFATVLPLLLAGCASTTQTSTSGGSPPPVGTAFLFNTTVVDTRYGTSEPSILAAPNGDLWIAGPTGFVSPVLRQDPEPYTHDSGLFVSRDGGATWSFNARVPMYGRDACPGGGDSDLAAAPDGALFLIDLNLANVPIDVSLDDGETWLFNCNTSVLPGIDRQWVAATNEHVWIAVRHGLTDTQADLGLIVYRSDRLGVPADGLVFGPPVQVACKGPAVGDGVLAVDQRSSRLYLSCSDGSVFTSADLGVTWQRHETGLKGRDLSASFVSLALDAQGNAFVAGAGPAGVVVSGSHDGGATWTPAATFAPYAGKYAFAWVAAGGNGTVDVAWYGWPEHGETGPLAGPEDGYYVFAAQSRDLLSAGAQASAVYARVSPSPVSTKELCIGIQIIPPPPTPCDVSDPSKTRALGDFFETTVDAQGRFLIAYVDATKEPPALLFAKQTDGVLAQPA